MYKVQKLLFFSGHSHIYESYLCHLRKDAQARTDTSDRPKQVILESLKIKRKNRNKNEDKIGWSKLQNKI